MEIQIYSKNDEPRLVIRKLEYNGEWMGECYVTFDVESPVPLNLRIGDWLEYRGERFTLHYDPAVNMVAKPETYGGAYKYQGIKFVSFAEELVNADFLDYVLNENDIHFTGLPEFSFFADAVSELASRLQANMDRFCSQNNIPRWEFTVQNAEGANTAINVSISNLSCWDALALVQSDFNTNFIIRGRKVIIGSNATVADHIFKMGKTGNSLNGLYEFQKQAETDQKIVTRLRAYGSERNLPRRYYNKLTAADGKLMIPDNMAVRRLMLPAFPYSTLDPFIDSPNISELGVREDTVIFDGSNDLPEIYPSIEEATASDLLASGYPTKSTGRIDEIVSAEQVEDNGVGTEKNGEIVPDTDTFTITVKDWGFDINDYWCDDTPQISFKNGMLGGRDFEIIQSGEKKPVQNENGTWTLTLYRVYDDSIGLWFPYSRYNARQGDQFVVLGIEMPEIYIKTASQRLLTAATEYLSKNDYARSTYAPKVDKVYMARQHQEFLEGKQTVSLYETIKEGDLMLFEEESLGIGTSSVYIDKLVIKEGEESIPLYEITLKEEKTVGTLDRIQNEIDSIKTGGGGGGYNAAQIRQLIQTLGKAYFLMKNGTPDTSRSRTYFEETVSSDDFLQGLVGGAGWGAYKDENGKWVFETDNLVVREDMIVNSLTVNQIKAIGGMNIYSVASIEVSDVEEPEGENIYRCYFELKEDYIANLFRVDDVAYSHKFTPENTNLSYYKRKVVAIGEDYIDLSKDSQFTDGSGIPQKGDVIVQYGNYTDKTRQFVIILDVQGGGYIRFLCDLDSVNATGKEYGFQGYQSSTGARWLIGDKASGQYIEYVNGKLYIPGQLILDSNFSDGQTMIDYIKKNSGNRTFNEMPTPPYDEGDLWTNATYPEDGSLYNGEILRCVNTKTEGDFSIDDWELADGYMKEIDSYKYLKDALNGRTEIGGGLILTSHIQLGTWENSNLTTYSGINGIFNKPTDIAAWYGGDMLDGELAKWIDRDKTRYAQALFRFDGTGYLAGGNIGWNADGSGWFANHNLEWDSHGQITLGTGIKVGGTDIGDLGKSIQSIWNFIVGLSRYLVPVDKSLKELYSEDDLPNWMNNDVYAICAKKGFYSEEWVSAFGVNDNMGSGTGVSYLEDLMDVKLSGLASGQSLMWDGRQWVNRVIENGLDIPQLESYLTGQGYLKTVSWEKVTNKPSWIGSTKPTYTFSELTSHPNTLAGYGITDAITAETANNTFVKKVGDTMTGNLTLPMLYVKGSASSNAYIGADSAYNMYVNVNGKFAMVYDGQGNTVRPGTAYDNTFSLGASNARWSHVYSTLGNFSGLLTAAQLKIGGATLTWDGTALKIDTGLYSEQWISIFGKNDQASGVGGASYLADLIDVSLTNLASDQMLVWNGSRWVNRNIQSGAIDATQLESILNGKNYATQSWANANYVTALGVSGNNLTWTKNGTVNSITVPFATYADSATSANQLANSRTIWGQSFNGTTDVDGLFRALISGSPASGNGSVVHKVLAYPTNPFGLVTTINQAGTVMMQSQREAGSEYFNLSFNHLGGNVGFGTNSPEYKVHIAGTLFASGATTLSSTLTVSGLITASSGIKIGDATLMWDGTALKINTGLYSEKWISVFGKNDDADQSSKWLDEVALAQYLEPYAKKDWVLSQLGSVNLTDYLSLNGGAMRNTNLVTNMNADLLDGIHISEIPHYDTWMSSPGWDSDERGNHIRFTYQASGAPATGTVLSVQARYYGFQLLTRYAGDGPLYYRRFGSDTDGGLGTWQQLARITDNVASATYATSAGNASYATSSGNSDTLDGLHETSFMRRISASLTTGSDITQLYRSCGYALTYNTDLAAPSNGAFIGFGASNYYKVLHGDATSNNLLLKTYSNGSWSGWRTFAFEDSNVASASRLATNSTFTAWGQTYFLNGVPQSISGDLSNVGTITASDGRRYMWVTGDYTMIGDSTPSHTILARGSSILLQTTVGAYDLYVVNNNVGIGLSAPSYKLHVNGSVGVNDVLYINNTGTTSSIQFARPGINYFYANGSAGGFAFITNAKSFAAASADLRINDGYVYPGTNNVTMLGQSSLRWSNVFSMLGNFSGAVTMSSTLNVSGLLTASSGIKIGDATIVWDSANGGLKINTGLYSTSWISALGINSELGGDAGPYLPLSGGTMTGNLNITKTDSTTTGIALKNSLGALQVCVGTDGIMGLWNTTSSVWILGCKSNNVGIGGGPNTNYRLYVSGTIAATGAVTQNVSDIRLKTDIESVNCMDKLLKMGNVVSYRYNYDAVRVNPELDTITRHIGFIYQNAINADICGFAGYDNGYGWLNYLSSDFLATLTGGLIETYRRQESMELRLQTLEAENKLLKERIKQLEEA